MNELNKLIQQYETENPGEKAFHERIFVGGSIRVYHEEFVEWLASRPTCGKEQRKFLDEVEGNAYLDSSGDMILHGACLFQEDIESAFHKVIKGE